MFQRFDVVSWLQKSPEMDRVVIDVGACDGRFLDLQAPNFRHVYAIEPEVRNFAILRKSAAVFENVTCLNKAVGSHGEHLFWHHLGPMNHTINQAFTGQKSGWVAAYTVCGITLDQLWSEIKSKGETIGLIMFDAEGAEDFAFDNAHDLLDENRDWLCVILETHDGVNLRRLHHLFSEKGYDCSLDGAVVDKLEQYKQYILRKRYD